MQIKWSHFIACATAHRSLISRVAALQGSASGCRQVFRMLHAPHGSTLACRAVSWLFGVCCAMARLATGLATFRRFSLGLVLDRTVHAWLCCDVQHALASAQRWQRLFWLVSS